MLPYEVLCRGFSKAWATIETAGEEVVVTRNRRRVARIVPEPAPATAMEVFGDLHGVLGEHAGAVLARKLATARNGRRRRDSLRELRNPWAS